MMATRLVRRVPLSVPLALSVFLASVWVGVPAGQARHETGATRTFTYEVRQRGTVATPLEDFAHHAAAALRDVRGWSLGGSLAYRRVPSRRRLHAVAARGGTGADLLLRLQQHLLVPRGTQRDHHDTRWRTATPSWTLGLGEYRSYVLMHELGHWHGTRPRRLRRRGQAAPVMRSSRCRCRAARPTCGPLGWERDAVARRYGVAVRPDLFTDIADSVHAEAIRRHADLGHLTGFADGFVPRTPPVSREQLATSLARRPRCDPRRARLHRLAAAPTGSASGRWPTPAS
jgi:hypothetical protein